MQRRFVLGSTKSGVVAAMVCLLCLAFLADMAEAARIVVPCAGQRQVTLTNARQLRARLSNRGDCSYQILLFDPIGNVVLNTQVFPGETRDLSSASVQVKSAQIFAGAEPGVIGAVVVAVPLAAGREVRMPMDFDSFACDGMTRTILTCDDGAKCPQVTYRVRNDAGRCPVQVTRTTAAGANMSTVADGTSEDFTGSYTSITVTCNVTKSRTCAFFYTRNP